MISGVSCQWSAFQLFTHFSNDRSLSSHANTPNITNTHWPFTDHYTYVYTYVHSLYNINLTPTSSVVTSLRPLTTGHSYLAVDHYGGKNGAVNSSSRGEIVWHRSLIGDLANKLKLNYGLHSRIPLHSFTQPNTLTRCWLYCINHLGYRLHVAFLHSLEVMTSL